MIVDKHSQGRARAIAILLVSVLAIHATGCGDNSAAIRAVQDAVQTSTNYSQQANQSDLLANEDQDPGHFTPANPGRSNPFESKVSETVDAGSSGIKGVSSASQIVVMGFAEMGTTRVMLRIGDQTKILKEGERFGGVTVESIEPPRVQLKMDNLMWTATMFDERGK